MESFDLIFKGELRKGYSPNDLPKILASLNFKDKHINHVQSGKKLTIKKGLDSKQGLAYQRTLEELGLVTYLSLKLNPNCLLLGLKNKKIKNVKKIPSLNLDDTLVFDDVWTSPKFLVLPGQYDIKSKEGDVVGGVHQHSIKTSSFSRILLAILITLPLQFYFTRLMSEFFGSGIVMTLLGIIFLFSGLVFLPTILNFISVTKYYNREDIQGTVIDDVGFFPNKRSCRVYDSNNKYAATITIKKSEVVCWSFNGNLLFKWSINNHLSESKDIISTISDKVIEDTIFSHVSDYIDNLKKVASILTFFTTKAAPSAVVFEYKNASPILDNKGNIAAAVFSKPSPAVCVSAEYQEFNFILHAIAAATMERPLV